MKKPPSRIVDDALIHLSSGEKLVSEIPGISAEAASPEVRRAAVVGAGTMGSGIAMVYADAGIPVVLKEVSADRLDRGVAAIRRRYQDSMNRGRLLEKSVERSLGLIQPVLDYSGFEEADIVVEAAYESMEVKQEIFRELDRICRRDAMLASNTSSLDIDRLAAVTSRPQRVIGHHFFAPPHVMRLLEIVRGRWTSENTIASSLKLAGKLGKIGVVVGNCRGFVGNRMYHQYQREAQLLLEEGAQVPQVDEALCGFGMAMGPLVTGDLSGLDVGWRIRREHGDLEAPGRRRTLVVDRLCELGRYGQKTGAGWYRYETGSRVPIPDPEVERLVEQCARDAGVRRRSISAAEIVERTTYALANEGAKILEEGLALRAVDIDIIFVRGYGFPAWRGGPMWFAGTLGLRKVYERICTFRQEHGDTWAPASLLKELAERGKTFAEFDARRGVIPPSPSRS